MKTRFLISTLCIAFFSITSCKKSSDPASCETTVANLSGAYKLTAEKLTVGSIEQDVLPTYDACELDDVMTLKTDGTYIHTDAGTTCGGDDSGTWGVSGNTFTIDGETGTIVSFDCHNLVISHSELGGTITSTYTK